MKTVLISGGAGFIGSHLVKHHIDRGHRVIVVDNLYTGKEGNIKPFYDKGVSFLRKDISLCNFNYFQGIKFDEVLHFASPASPIHYMQQPFMTMKANSVGTEFLLDLAARDKAKFLLASTSEIYGDPTVHPQTEAYWGNVNSFGSRSCYDESKRFAETLTYLYIKHMHLDARIVRTFNVYGPGMCKEDGRAIPAFISQALQNKPLTVFGNGLQTRSLCYIDDYVDGVTRLLESNVKTPVNIGNPHEITMLELAHLIKSLCNSNSEIQYHPLPEDDPKQRCPDISIAESVLDWRPSTFLEEGLLKTIEYFKEDQR